MVAYHSSGRHQGGIADSRLPLSVLGHERTLHEVRMMSALPPKADIGIQPRNVCFVPKADIASLLLNGGDLTFPCCSLQAGIITLNLVCVGQRKFTHGFIKFVA